MSLFLDREKKGVRIFTKVLSIVLVFAILTISTPVTIFANDSSNEDFNDIQEEQPYILQELEENRTINTKQFLMNDNTVQAVMYNEPVHYEENGEWEEIDNSLDYQESTNDNDFNGYKTRKGDFSVKFAKKANSKKIVKISKDKYHLSWDLLDKNKVLSSISNVDIEESKTIKDSVLSEECVKNVSQSVKYKNIMYNVDLEYTVNGTGLKENIIINKALSDYTFTFEIKADNLALSLQNDNSIIATDLETNECIYTIPAMFMYDSAGEMYKDINVSLEQQNKNKYKLTVDANCEWINNEQRQFPIIIDPYIKTKQVDEAIDIGCVSSKKKTENLAESDNCLLGGYDSTYGFTRLLLRFDLPELNPNDMVIDARLNLYEIGLQYSNEDMDDAQINAHMIKTTWSSSPSWLFQPLYEDTVLDYELLKKSDVSELKKGRAVAKTWNITKAVKAWYENDKDNNGIVLKDYNILSDGGTIFGKFAVDSGQDTSAYPFLIISYRNSKGLENYWTYTSVDSGNNDIAYINDYSGNVVATHIDVETTGNRLPVTIEHIYNSCISQRMYTKIYPSCGMGWKLNIQQTIRSSEQYGLTGDVQEMFPYVYEDGDGTEHYFYAKETGDSTKYYDEDGLGLELKIVQDGYQIVDSNKNVTTFDNLGNITGLKNHQKIESEITIEYSDVILNDKTVKVISAVTDGSGHRIILNSKKSTYGDSNEILLLDSIIDESSNKISMTYSSNKSLSSIDSPVSGKTVYNYTTIYSLLEDLKNSKSDKKIKFNYKTLLYGKRLLGVSECNDSEEIYKITYDRHLLNETKITTSLLGKSNITYVQFDNAGRTVSTYNQTSDKLLFYSSKNNYNAACINSTGSNIKQINTLNSSSKAGSNTENLLRNPSGEYNGIWGAASAVGNCSFTSSYTTEEKYSGRQSFKLTSNSSSNDGRARFYQDLNSEILVPGETYTLSAYVKTKNLRQVSNNYNYGAILIVTTDASTSTSYSSNYIKGTTSNALNNGWQRLYVTFTIPESATLTRINLVVRNSIGTVYFDNVQLEKGNTPSAFNLLENSCMRYVDEDRLMPYKWAYTSTVTDRCDLENKHEYFEMEGVAEVNKYIRQDVPITGKESDTYTVSGWALASASCSSNSNRAFDICVKVTYSDNSCIWKPEAVFNTGVAEWQYASQTFDLSDGTDAEKTPVLISIYPRYKAQVNSVLFTNFQLIQNNGNSYSYDTNGNLINKSSGYSNSVKNTYSGNNITKSIDKSGYSTDYTYDSYDNLKSISSQREVLTNYEYDDYGNITSAVKSNKDGTLKMAADSVYNEETENGIKAGAYLVESVDENGLSTYYNYDYKTGNIKSVTDSTGNTISYSYNKDNSLSRISNDDIWNSYGYSQGNLTSITRTYDNYTTQKYNFSYGIYGELSQASVGNRTLFTSSVDKNAKTATTVYGNNDTTKLSYSPSGLLLSKSLNDTIKYKWQYDNSGNVFKYTDLENNLYSTYEYDTMNRVSAKSTFHSNDKEITLTTFKYDEKGNISKISNSAGGNVFVHDYTYTKDNLVSRLQMAYTKHYDYTYDSLNRVSRKALHISDDNIVNIDYSYCDSNRNTLGDNTYTTNRLQSEIVDDIAYRYGYDIKGNIVSVDCGIRDGNTTEAKDYSRVLTYQYDKLNQLTREDNKYLNQTIVYEYDGAGNIKNKSFYPYTEGTIESPATKSIDYSYGDGNWKDLLTSYDGNTIQYDGIGNPTSYLGNTLGWEGRQLKSLSNDDLNVSYTYDANGLRVSKTVNGVKTYYQYSGNKLLYQETGNQRLYFWYDAFGNLCEICLFDETREDAYYVTCNSKGDVDTIYNYSGIVAKYNYDSWGNTVSVTDSNGNEITDSNHIGNINPIRYRGYYYDTESGLFYLQSRYYNPTIGRFLNADVYCDTGASFLGTNMFAYCYNNPVMYSDPTGRFTATEVVGIVITEIFVCLDLQVIAEILKVDFSFDGLEDYMQNKAHLYKEWFDKCNKFTKATGTINKVASFVSGFSTHIPNSKIKIFCGALPYFTTAINDFSGRYISVKGSAYMLGYDWLTYSAGFIGSVGASGGNKKLETFFSFGFTEFFEVFGLNNAEYMAYNWYLCDRSLL